MLQIFHLDVSKVDLDVVHVAMAIHACFKCFICFIHMLQMFHLDVAKIDLILHVCCGYTHMFQAHFYSVSHVSDICCKCFIWMFQK
jgi:hypothetical protein